MNRDEFTELFEQMMEAVRSIVMHQVEDGSIDEAPALTHQQVLQIIVLAANEQGRQFDELDATAQAYLSGKLIPFPNK